jgi:zinc transporter ZupT
MVRTVEQLADSPDAGADGSALVFGLGLVAVATVLGALLAHRRGGPREVWFGVAAGALLVIALAHLLPDAWSAANDARLPWWLVPQVAVASFAISTAVGRAGCACPADEEHAGGTASAAALAAHRFLEGAALALAGVITAVALAVHALAEGLAVGTLLRTRPRRMLGWLAVMCIGPVSGAVAADAIPPLDIATPLLYAVAAGVLAHAARISFRAAFPHRTGRWLLTAPTLAACVSTAVTAVAVYAVG